MLKASFHGATDVGKIREINEDAYIAQYIWDRRHVLLAAIDGLGGYEGGEVAAGIAQRTITSYMENSHGDCLDLLKEAIAEANNEIVRQKISNPSVSQMGCVATVCVLELDASRLIIAHVGDTRLYQFYKNQLQKLTHDHSPVGEMEDNRMLSEQDAMNHPRRNIVERFLGEEEKGASSPNFIEAGIFPLSAGMQFLLCSDGLSDLLTSQDISSVLSRYLKINNKVSTLIKLANNKGGNDNITAVIASISGYATPQNNNIKHLKESKHKNVSSVPIDNVRKFHGLTIIWALISILSFVFGLIVGVLYSNFK